MPAPRLSLSGASSDGQRASTWPKVDVVKLAATPWAPDLVALSMFEELLFAVPHSSRDGSVVTSRDERQPFQNGGNRHNVDLLLLLRQRPADTAA